MGISALLASQILDASATGRSVITGADASAIRTTLGLGTLATQSPTGTPSASTFLRGDFSWQTIDLSGYLQLTGGTMTGALAITQATANTSVLTSTGYSLTGSNAQSLVDVAGTWNTTGTPTLIKANVTDTASNAASLLMDLQVGGTSRFSVRKDGSYSVPLAAQAIFGAVSPYGMWQGFNGSLYFGTPPSTTHLAMDANGFYLRSTGGLRWSTSATDPYATGLALFADANDTLAQRRSTNAQRLNLYGTYTDASNYERAKIAWESNVLRIGTEKSGTGSARALELQTDGTTRLTIGTNGDVTVSRGVTSSSLGFTSTEGGVSAGIYSNFASSNPGCGTVTNHQFCIYTNAAKRLEVAANGSALTFSDALNIAVGTTTGTKIGTATTQKLGFYNATPVVQPTAVADATDAASVITQLNALLSRMRDLGLIAT